MLSSVNIVTNAMLKISITSFREFSSMDPSMPKVTEFIITTSTMKEWKIELSNNLTPTCLKYNTF